MGEIGNDSSTAAAVAHCPYCAAELKRRPQRKSSCKSCGATIFVKARPGESEKLLLTEAEAVALEAEWRQHYQERATLGHVECLRLSVDAFNQCRSARPDLPVRDIIWGLLNEEVRVLAPLATSTH